MITPAAIALPHAHPGPETTSEISLCKPLTAALAAAAPAAASAVPESTQAHARLGATTIGPSTATTMDTLDTIIRHTRERVNAAKSGESLRALQARTAAAPVCRPFIASLRAARPTAAIIAEIKRKSPSAGWMRPEYAHEDFSPEAIATKYEHAGAAAISCLTDSEFFGGAPAYIARVKHACTLPVLRKDFIVDSWQVWESRAIGADAVLLMAECLDDNTLRDCAALAVELGLGVLLEIHEERNFERALDVVRAHPGAILLGINNRDLSTMKVDLAHTRELAARVPDRSWLVSESGIRTPADLASLRSVGVRIALVGEHLMKQADPGAALAELLAGRDT
jgi:indole-3-glycerol phosphate synthase